MKKTEKHFAAIRFLDALDRDYWSELNPALSVCKKLTAVRKKEIQQSDISSRIKKEVAAAIQATGWAEIESVVPKQTFEPLAKCILSLEDSGWLPIFCFVYDEFWHLTRTPALTKVLTECLGPRYQQKSAVWAHLVHTSAGSRGWSPHVDIAPVEGNPIGKNGMPRYLSVWIPLTDATVENGCMYLLPADRVRPGKLRAEANINHLLHAVQAVPLKAGSVGLWRQDLMHWGSFVNEKAKESRISIAFEFQAFAKGNPIYPLFDGAAIPQNLEDRLIFIAEQILSYLPRWDQKRWSVEHMKLAAMLQKLPRSPRSVFRGSRANLIGNRQIQKESIL